ncbi:MAG: TetR family transcriptional regulator [Myxococcales bacterium]|nr:TetR family transcriptional regulator [Myxococcales bacterium]
MRGKLDRGQVLQAALAMVDRDGLEGLSMRRLGEALGVEAMSLYRHVANKDEVLDGVHEAVLSSVVWPRRTGRWQADLVAAAWALREALRRHPHARPLFATRPATTPASLGYLEHALGLLEEPFPHPLRRVLAAQVVFALVIGHAMLHDGAAQGTGPEGLDPEELPILTSVLSTLEGYDPEEELRFALESLIASWG